MLAKKLRAAGQQGDGILRWAETAAMTVNSQSISNTPASGDLLFFIYYTDEFTGDEGATPSGWTNIGRASETSAAYNCCYKISDGTETSVAHGITTAGSLTLGTYVLACFQGVDSVAITDFSYFGTNVANRPVLDLGTVGATDICIQATGVDDQVSGVAVPSGYTEALIATVGTAGNGCTVAVCYQKGANSGNWTHDAEPTFRAGLRYTQ